MDVDSRSMRLVDPMDFEFAVTVRTRVRNGAGRSKPIGSLCLETRPREKSVAL